MRAVLLLMLLLGCSHKVRIVAPTAVEPRVAHEASAKEVMVATQGQATTRAALKIFNQGGNIIDAFVAASFAISVERPHSTGIGGGGFLLYFAKEENKVYAFDFREVAPLLATSNMYLTKKGDPQPLLSQEGALAVATPGLVKGLYEIHGRFGKLPWKDTIRPAIELARNGFPLYEQLQEALTDRRSLLQMDPEAKKTFFTQDGRVPLLGTIIYQENLAKTLELIADKGEEGFYKGKVADAIIKTVKKKRGLLTHKDFKAYEVKEREPVTGAYKGLKIFSMPPPSSGGIHVIQILKMLEPHDLKDKGPQSTEAVHLTAMAMQRAFIDRANYLGDPDFNPVPVKELLNEKYLKKLSRSIDVEKATPADKVKAIPLPYESSDTVHFSIADKEGNLVASTQTINGWFGSGVMAQGTGIVLNNEMDDFAQKAGAQNLFGAVGGRNNLVQPRKRPLSSMSPTIMTKDGQPFMAVGSPSGTRIITCVAQTILNSVEFEMPLYEAVAATRIHQQWLPDQLKIEAPYLDPKVEKELKDLGHNVVHERLGCSIQAIKKTKKGWDGVSDPRGEGLALGL
ncbi:gamma-glutamyltransferase [Peredibacter starrii]|uniref:Glutathione hydrolase proenzyme n=1 Tax=Peredibacter starrii TaxID=28202 RepID=A0AAX4HJC6_9BACT|nr:gamma-glutamyltransferase [Peredibacter starrii]WPU63333.1 gamma-glutamyltransferase [Peredibacter starrii]